MQQILVYSDSLSWGIIPGSRNRLPFEQRWPGVFEQELCASGRQVRVIENCLNGRRTVWSDPFKPGRKATGGLSVAVEMNSPLAWVILMLGTNDFQATHDNVAWMSAQGTARLIRIIREAPIEPGMPLPQILLVCPPVIRCPAGDMKLKFAGAENRCQGLGRYLQEVAALHDTDFFDSGDVVEASSKDGIHLDASEHQCLGSVLAQYILQQK